MVLYILVSAVQAGYFLLWGH